MLNRTILVGRLTRDPELRYMGDGTATASFSLAVNRQFKNKQGEREADFINCVIWRKAAETFCNYTHKGSQVAIDGRIQTRNYENSEGTRVYVTEIVVENFSFLDSGNGLEGKKKASSKDDPFANNGEEIDISDDSLPF